MTARSKAMPFAHHPDMRDIDRQPIGSYHFEVSEYIDPAEWQSYTPEQHIALRHDLLDRLYTDHGVLRLSEGDNSDCHWRLVTGRYLPLSQVFLPGATVGQVVHDVRVTLVCSSYDRPF